jgi:hypothetical protein
MYKCWILENFAKQLPRVSLIRFSGFRRRVTAERATWPDPLYENTEKEELYHLRKSWKFMNTSVTTKIMTTLRKQ